MISRLLLWMMDWLFFIRTGAPVVAGLLVIELLTRPVELLCICLGIEFFSVKREPKPKRSSGLPNLERNSRLSGAFSREFDLCLKSLKCSASSGCRLAKSSSCEVNFPSVSSNG